MLPYLAQGAAQAIEDAGVLQVVLNKSSTDIGLAIKIYEQVRKPVVKQYKARHQKFAQSCTFQMVLSRESVTTRFAWLVKVKAIILICRQTRICSSGSGVLIS